MCWSRTDAVFAKRLYRRLGRELLRGLSVGLWGDFWVHFWELGAAKAHLPTCRDLSAQLFNRATGSNVEIGFGLRGVDDATRRVDEDVFSA